VCSEECRPSSLRSTKAGTKMPATHIRPGWFVPAGSANDEPYPFASQMLLTICLEGGLQGPILPLQFFDGAKVLKKQLSGCDVFCIHIPTVSTVEQPNGKYWQYSPGTEALGCRVSALQISFDCLPEVLRTSTVGFYSLTSSPTSIAFCLRARLPRVSSLILAHSAGDRSPKVSSSTSFIFCMADCSEINLPRIDLFPLYDVSLQFREIHDRQSRECSVSRISRIQALPPESSFSGTPFMATLMIRTI
jgi:hypothetical protein